MNRLGNRSTADFFLKSDANPGTKPGLRANQRKMSRMNSRQTDTSAKLQHRKVQPRNRFSERHAQKSANDTVLPKSPTEVYYFS